MEARAMSLSGVAWMLIAQFVLPAEAFEGRFLVGADLPLGLVQRLVHKPSGHGAVDVDLQGQVFPSWPDDRHASVLYLHAWRPVSFPFPAL